MRKIKNVKVIVNKFPNVLNYINRLLYSLDKPYVAMTYSFGFEFFSMITFVLEIGLLILFDGQYSVTRGILASETKSRCFRFLRNLERLK